MTKVATWPDEMLLLLLLLERVKLTDLPPAPWVLRNSKGRLTASGQGGPFVTIRNTEKWLRCLRMDVAQGPLGARARSGGLMADLEDLDLVLKRKAATEGRLFLCTAEGCGAILTNDEKPERCHCGAELGEKAGWRAERWAGVAGPHTKTMNNTTRKYGF